MITLAAYELHAPAPTLAQLADELCSRVMDCAVFYRWRDNPDGTHTPFFQLTKPLNGLPAGVVLSLRDLHDRLAGSLYAK